MIVIVPALKKGQDILDLVVDDNDQEKIVIIHKKITRQKNVSQDNQLQEFIQKIIELTNAKESTKTEKITEQKNVSHDIQLQAFLTKRIELTNERANKLVKIMRMQNFGLDIQLHVFISTIIELKSQVTLT